MSPVSGYLMKLLTKPYARPLLLIGLTAAAIAIPVARGLYGSALQSQPAASQANSEVNPSDSPTPTSPIIDLDHTDWKQVFDAIDAKPINELILADLPELQSPDLSKAEQINLIRHWVAQQIDIAQNNSLNCLGKPACRDPFYQAGIAKVIEAYRENKIAVLCGGAADTLRLVYDALGYRSLTLAMGTLGKFTHMVTLVELQEGDRKQLIVQDPMLDTAYSTRDGKLLDYFEMLSLLKQGHADQIVPTNPDGIVRDRQLKPEKPGQPIQIVEMPMTIQNTVVTDRRVTNTLQSAGCPSDATYLYALPFAFYSVAPEEAEALQTKAHQILGKGCMPDTVQ
jgi:hypothetical protein